MYVINKGVCLQYSNSYYISNTWFHTFFFFWGGGGGGEGEGGGGALNFAFYAVVS